MKETPTYETGSAAGAAADETAALVEMYNRRALEAPRDPWADKVEETYTDALNDVYN